MLVDLLNNSGRTVVWVGCWCVTRIKARPESALIPEKNSLKASSPPAEAPIPTMGKELPLNLGEETGFRLDTFFAFDFVLVSFLGLAFAFLRGDDFFMAADCVDLDFDSAVDDFLLFNPFFSWQFSF